jgi:hypothetical protein
VRDLKDGGREQKRGRGVSGARKNRKGERLILIEIEIEHGVCEVRQLHSRGYQI